MKYKWISTGDIFNKKKKKKLLQPYQVNKKTMKIDIKEPIPFDINSINIIKKKIVKKINTSKSLTQIVSPNYERYYFFSANYKIS